MEDFQVSSELYSEFDYTSDSIPSVSKINVVSEFRFKIPAPPKLDSDGDLIVERKSNSDEFVSVLKIEHSKSTALNLVGLQIWRGALLLADWFIYNSKNIPKNSMILELGSGVGLTSIIAAMSHSVVCTDIDKGKILELIRCNLNRNKQLIKCPVKVLELDFFSSQLKPELERLLPEVQIVLAADVIYDDTITVAFVNTIKALLSSPPKRSVYVALEKRYVFTIADCATCAPCYEYFLDCLKSLENVHIEELALDFPQYFQYDRVKELVLWKITSMLF